MIAKIFTSKSVGTGPSSYEKRIYRAAVSQRLRNTDIDDVVALEKRRGSTANSEPKFSHWNEISEIADIHN